MKKNLLFAVSALFATALLFTSCTKNETAEPIAEVKNEYKYSKIIEVSDEANLVTQTIKISSDDASLIENFGVNNIRIYPVMKGEDINVVSNSIPPMFENNTNLPKQEWNPTKEELDNAPVVAIDVLETKKSTEVINVIRVVGHDETLTRAPLTKYVEYGIYPSRVNHWDKAWFVDVKFQVWDQFESQKASRELNQIVSYQDLDNSKPFTDARAYLFAAGVIDPTYKIEVWFWAKAKSNYGFTVEY